MNVNKEFEIAYELVEELTDSLNRLKELTCNDQMTCSKPHPLGAVREHDFIYDFKGDFLGVLQSLTYNVNRFKSMCSDIDYAKRQEKLQL